MYLAVNKETLFLLDLFDLNSHKTKSLGIIKAVNSFYFTSCDTFAWCLQ